MNALFNVRGGAGDQPSSKAAAVLIGLAYFVIVAAADTVSPILISFFPFYLCGIAFLGWRVGLRSALIIALGAAMVTSIQDWDVAQQQPSHKWIVLLNAVCTVAAFAGTAWITSRFAGLNNDLSRLVWERSAAFKDESERHKATAAELVEANERFSQVINNIAEVFWLLDLDGPRVIYVSPSYERIWGEPVEHLYADDQAWLRLLHPDDREAIGRSYPQKQKSGNYDVEYRILRRDGEIRWIRDRAFPVRNVDGEIYRIAGIAQDITEQKRTEEVLKIQAQVLENMAEAAVMVDDAGLIALTNPAANSLLNYGPGELLGKRLESVAAMDHEEFQTAFVQHSTDIAAGKTLTREYSARRKDGTSVLLELRLSGFLVNSRMFFILVGQDVSERKRSQQALLEQEQRYRTLFELCPDGILLESSEGDILDVNNAICQSLGYSRAELVGKNVRSLASYDNRHFIESNLVDLRAGKALEQEVWNIHKNGTRRLMRLNEKPIGLPDGRQGIMVVARDVTERKREELARETLLSLGARLSMARTPIAAAEAIFASANQLWEWDAATLDLYHPDSDRMEHVVNYDILEGQRRQVPSVRSFMPPTTRMRRVMQGGPELVLRHRDSLADLNSLPFGDTARRSASIMAVPLRRDHQRIGVLSIHSYTFDAYTETDLQKLQGLADHCGAALDRIRAEAALRESEERYRALAESSPDAILIFDRNARIKYANRVAAARWERTPQALLGSGPMDLFSSETAERHTALIESVFQTGQPLHQDVETSLRGGPRWQEIRLVPLGSPTGDTNLVMEIARDITDRKHTEQRLAEALDLNQEVIAASSIGIAAYRATGECVFANQAYSALTQETEAPFASDDFHSLPLFVTTGLVRLAENTLKTGQPGRAEFHASRKHGDVWGDCHVTTFNSGGESHLLFLLNDISKQKRIEAALRESEERYRSVVEDQTEIISRFTPDGRLVFANEAFCRFFGRKIEDVLGRKWQPQAAPEEIPEIQTQLDTLSPSRPVVIIENTVFSQGGRRHWMQFANRALFGSDGAIREIQSVGRDLTERKRAEEALRASESTLTAIFRILPVGISIVSEDGKIRNANPALCKALNVSAESLKSGENLRWNLFSADRKPMSLADIPSRRAIQQQREFLNVEIEIEKPDATRLWVSVNAAPLPGIGAVVSTVDITERKRGEFLLRAQRDLAAGMNETAHLKTATQRFLDLLLKVEGFDFGSVYLFDPVTGALDLGVHSEPRMNASGTTAGLSHTETRALEKGKPLYFTIEQIAAGNPDSGAIKDITAAALLPLTHAGIAHGAAKLCSRSQTEIAEPVRRILETLAGDAAGAIARFRAEEALHRSETRLRTLVSTAPVLLFACDRDGLITLEDGAALKALGIKPGARAGKSIFEIYAHVPLFLNNIRRALRGEEFNSIIELEGCAFDCWFAPVHDRDGQIIGFNGIGTNITDRYRLERQILEISDREQARIGQDLHDGLCQQLVTLAFDANSLHANLARHKHRETTRAARIGAELDDAISEARHLARGLFPVRLESEGLAPALEELAATTKKRFGVDCQFTSDVTPVLKNSAVATHLYRIAQEAVTNAIRHGKATRIVISLRSLPRELELRVVDNGRGLVTDADTASQGMGMGLHIMDYRSRAVFGTLRILPTDGQGVTISCCVPHA